MATRRQTGPTADAVTHMLMAGTSGMSGKEIATRQRVRAAMFVGHMGLVHRWRNRQAMVYPAGFVYSMIRGEYHGFIAEVVAFTADTVENTVRNWMLADPNGRSRGYFSKGFWQQVRVSEVDAYDASQLFRKKMEDRSAVGVRYYCTCEFGDAIWPLPTGKNSWEDNEKATRDELYNAVAILRERPCKCEFLVSWRDGSISRRGAAHQATLTRKGLSHDASPLAFHNAYNAAEVAALIGILNGDSRFSRMGTVMLDPAVMTFVLARTRAASLYERVYPTLDRVASMDDRNNELARELDQKARELRASEALASSYQRDRDRYSTELSTTRIQYEAAQTALVAEQQKNKKALYVTLPTEGEAGSFNADAIRRRRFELGDDE